MVISLKTNQEEGMSLSIENITKDNAEIAVEALIDYLNQMFDINLLPKNNINDVKPAVSGGGNLQNDLIWTNVESSNVSRIAITQGILFVEYTNRSRTSATIYAYIGVSDLVFNQLLKADSVGKYINQNIKPVYKFLKLA